MRFIARDFKKASKIMMESIYYTFAGRSIVLKKMMIFLCVALLSIHSGAQSFQRKINWLETPAQFRTLDDKNIRQPSFEKAAHLEAYGLLPVYTEMIAMPAGGAIAARINNPVFVPSTLPDAASLTYIKDTLIYSAEWSFERKASFVYFSLLPFRKNPTTGAIERLESFSLTLDIKPKVEKRSTDDYATNSVLASGTWHKISVTADGIYKVDYNFIKNQLNVDPATINLSTLAVFGNGGGMVPDHNSIPRPDDLIENPTLLVDNNGNNRMDADDYLLFFGQMPDSWEWNPSTQLFVHKKNLYTTKTFYFLTTNAGTGKRVSPSPASGSPNKTITDFDERAFHESEEVNILQSGKTWLGDRMSNFANTKNFTFSFPNLITTSPVYFTSALAANSINGSTTTISINSQSPPVMSQFVSGIAPGTYVAAYLRSVLTASQFVNSSQLNITYSFNAPADISGNASAYIDYFELNFKRALSLSGDAMTFRNYLSVGAGSVSKFLLNNAGVNTRVWDITNLGNIMEMTGTLNGSQFSFTTSTDNLKEFIAFNSSATFSNPSYEGRVENQNLHAIGEPEMIIVTHDNFFAASNALADFHRTHDNKTVAVVKVSQIYNEFGSGKPDISAIRDFVKMLYDRAGGDTSLMPRYLLLMGDGSYDPQNRIASKTNFIATYQSDDSNNPTITYSSDDFYGLLDDNEGGNITQASQKLDVGIGRLPVETETEAWDVVNKIKNYKNLKLCAGCAQVAGNNTWRNTITFIADDQDGNTHIDASDELAETTRAKLPSYNYDKIYLDAYKQMPTPAGDRYPDVNTAIINRINTGSLIINWVGHGGPTNWAHERIFNMSDIVNFQNAPKLPLFITATCDFSAFDLAERTAGEWLIVNGKGGAIASITTVRLVYSNANRALNDVVFKYLFDPYHGRNPTLGEVTMLSKNNVMTDISNTRKFTLLGDPALTLNYPQYNVVTTMVNNKPIVLPQDTFKALSRMTIAGEVRDENGERMTSFNGTIYPWVYDKVNTVPTLGNDKDSPIRNFRMYKNLLFKGKASVTNGEFSFSFIVPKDINYQYGYGRISYYADNGNDMDAHGFNQTITIGGSADSAAMDHNGPQVNIFMNDEKFVFGGTTTANPLLLIKLEDESGINTMGNGVGHDLAAVLDENEQSKVILNDYYESELDNFQKGEVRYPLSKLKDGRHTLKVKAWDIHNNSSDEYTEFIVTSDAKIALNHVFNYPNPFTTRTQFMFEHNRPCDDLNVSVQIYTVSGKLVKTIVQQVNTTGYRVDNIEWNGLDEYGDPIGKGVYVYKVNVRDSSGNKAHKFEKLVVLR